jgi:hypothetical protein
MDQIIKAVMATKRKNPEKLLKRKINSLAKTIRTQIHKLRRIRP